MTITYSLAPNPKWYIADLTGKPLGAGTMFTYHSLDKTSFKFVFQDPGGNFAWPDPILFDENGSQGPFYFEFDSLNPNDTYYIEIYDVNGILQWTIDNFSPPGGGGGGNITTAIDLQNYVINNSFFNGISASSPVPLSYRLALSNHVGFCGSINPDIFFTKNIVGAIDSLQVIPFPVGTYPLTGDVTPVNYLNYNCTNNPVGETDKSIQFPIIAGVQNLSNTSVTLSIWAQIQSPGANTLTLSWYQFFGDGAGASPPIQTAIQTINLSMNWQRFIITTTIPSVAGMILGGCGNDCLLLKVGYPVSIACNINFTKLSLYLGNIAPQLTFETYDDISAIVNSPRTGDVRQSLINYSFNSEWLPMNNGTIGNASSNATTRADIDTFALYNILWLLPQAFVQSYNSLGVIINRGVSAVSDFNSNNSIALTKMVGRVMAASITDEISSNFIADFITNTIILSSPITLFSTGDPVRLFSTSVGGFLPSPLTDVTRYYVIVINSTTLKIASTFMNAILNSPIVILNNGSGTLVIEMPGDSVGEPIGEENSPILIANMPSHNHPGSTVAIKSAVVLNGTVGSTTVMEPGGSTAITVAPQGGNLPLPVIQPTVYMNTFIKL